jgi:hypothetical protein
VGENPSEGIRLGAYFFAAKLAVSGGERYFPTANR